MKAMAKEPRRRYASAHELAEDLRRFLKREPVRARPVGMLPRFLLWCRRAERIREASTITVAMSLMMALWEIQGAVFILSGLVNVPSMTKALIAPVGGAIFFLLLAGLGWLARMRTLAALWLGMLSTTGLFAFAIACLTGVIAIEGLTPRDVRLPVFGFFSIAAGMVIGSHAVSLVAYYSNRSAIRWSRQRSANPLDK